MTPTTRQFLVAFCDVISGQSLWDPDPRRYGSPSSPACRSKALLNRYLRDVDEAYRRGSPEVEIEEIRRKYEQDFDALWADATKARKRLGFAAIAGLCLALGAGAGLIAGVCMLLLSGYDIPATILAVLVPFAVLASIVALPKLQYGHRWEDGPAEGGSA